MTTIILYIINSEKYMEKIADIIKEVAGNRIIYITVNKPYKKIIEILKGYAIDYEKVFFIDCTSKGWWGKKDEEADNCLTIESPQNLTALSIAITEITKYFPDKKILFLDSLNSLFIYNDANIICKFLHLVINKMRSNDIDTNILAFESDDYRGHIKQIASCCDEVRRIS